MYKWANNYCIPAVTSSQQSNLLWGIKSGCELWIGDEIWNINGCSLFFIFIKFLSQRKPFWASVFFQTKWGKKNDNKNSNNDIYLIVVYCLTCK